LPARLPTLNKIRNGIGNGQISSNKPQLSRRRLNSSLGNSLLNNHRRSNGPSTLSRFRRINKICPATNNKAANDNKNNPLQDKEANSSSPAPNRFRGKAATTKIRAIKGAVSNNRSNSRNQENSSARNRRRRIRGNRVTSTRTEETAKMNIGEVKGTGSNSPFLGRARKCRAKDSATRRRAISAKHGSKPGRATGNPSIGRGNSAEDTTDTAYPTIAFAHTSVANTNSVSAVHP